MITNHPAHGPVSLDRLHQIREILSKASAQSDGGNLGYAMADAVKVIDVAIAVFGAEPVAWKSVFRLTGQPGSDFEKIFENRETMDAVVSLHERVGFNVTVTPLYTSPPVPVVPTFDEWLAIRGDKPLGWVKDAMRESYDACRAAMLQAVNFPQRPILTQELKWRAEQCECVSMCLDDNGVPKDEGDEELSLWGRVQRYAATSQAGNSPATLDCWIPVSERMPEESGRYWCYVEEQNSLGKSHYQWNFSWNGERWLVESDNGGRVTHWMSLPAAPQQD